MNYKPNFEIETGFTELDELWDANIRETKPDIARRARGVIERIFEDDPQATCIFHILHLFPVTDTWQLFPSQHMVDS